ncbi:MAG: DUF3261 domain-containing protein [Candidatus Omnitrophota bacterium]
MRPFLMAIAMTGMVLGLSACAGSPFKRTEYVPVTGWDPQRVKEAFESRLPQTWQMTESMIFSYRGHDLLGLGVTQIDRLKDQFSMVGLNPAGMKMIEISGDSKNLKCEVLVPELAQKGDVCRAVTEDVRRIYWDRTPSPEASSRKEKKSVIFSEKHEDGVLDYVFAGPEAILVEKRFTKAEHVEWRVRYYEYRSQKGKVFPGGVYFEHYPYHYKLTLRLKEIRS